MNIILLLLVSAAYCAADTFPAYVPFQLVKPNRDHTGFEVVGDTVSRIVSLSSSPKKKIAIVSVVGPYHSGKSFLLNALVGKTNTFSVGPKTSPETMGIWVCRTDIKLSNDTEVWFVDSEGFFGPNVSETYDAKIFTIAMLLGDEFIYNTVKIIDSQSVQMLEMLARRAQLFRVKSSAKEEEGQNFFRLPHLTWVVEDFVQETASAPQSGGSITSSSHWLESYLTPSADSNSSVPYLKKLFPSISVKPLFLPATTRQALMDLSKVPFDKLTEEFRKDLAELKKMILETHLGKSRNYKSPTEFGQAVYFLANALNKGLFPELPSLWNSWRTQVIDSSLRDSFDLFDATMSERIDNNTIPSLGDFESISLHARNSSLILFKELVRDFGSEEVVASGLDSLETQMRDRFDASSKKYVESVGVFVLEKMRHELSSFLSNSLFKGTDLIEPKTLETEMEKLFEIHVGNFRKILDQFLVKPGNLWFDGWIRVSIESSKTTVVLENLKTELRSQMESIKVENDKEIRKLISASVVEAVKSVDSNLVDPPDLLTNDQLEKFLDKIMTNSRKVFDSLLKVYLKWIVSFNPSYSQAVDEIKSEVGLKMEKFFAHHNARLSEWLRKQAQKAISVYMDMKRTIETSVLPCDDSVLRNEHKKAVNALTDSLDMEYGALKFNDTEVYRETRAGLDEVVSSEFEKLEAKNIELWKIHSDEATQCGIEMNVKFTEENCPQGWFCWFKVWPAKHRDISMDHLLECFSRPSKRKGVVPPRDIQERVFSSWYEKELAKEAAEVRNNMWIAGISLVVPLVWILYIRYAA